MVNVQKPRARGEPGVFTRDPVPGVRPAEPGTAGRGEACVHCRDGASAADTQQERVWPREPLLLGEASRASGEQTGAERRPEAETAVGAATQSSEGRAARVFPVITHNSPRSSPP